jgi:hypothetical protein
VEKEVGVTRGLSEYVGKGDRLRTKASNLRLTIRELEQSLVGCG